jgi:hypothetical protein
MTIIRRQKKPRGIAVPISIDAASRWHTVSSVALLVSLVVGVMATLGIWWMGNVKEEHSRREVAALGKATAEANARAAAANLELARLKTPRLLTEAQLASLTGEMTAFRGQRVGICVSSTTFETANFAHQLFQSLKDAGMLTGTGVSTEMTELGIVRGVVSNATRGNTKGERFAATFTKALNDRGIQAAWYDGRLEAVMQKLEAEQPGWRQRDGNEAVVIVGGDKP